MDGPDACFRRAPVDRRMFVIGVAALLGFPERLQAQGTKQCSNESRAGDWHTVSRLLKNKNNGIDMEAHCEMDSIKVWYGPAPGPALPVAAVYFIVPQSAGLDPGVTYQTDVEGPGLSLNLSGKIQYNTIIIYWNDGAAQIEAALMRGVVEFVLVLTNLRGLTRQRIRFVLKPKYPAIREKMFRDLQDLKSQYNQNERSSLYCRPDFRNGG